MAQISVILGSESDQKIVQESKLTQPMSGIGLTYWGSVFSAHRNPDELASFCRESVESGCKVFIGVAGMAAALPGAIAAATKMAVPVIAVPLDEQGIDSCLYMPPGVPVLLAGVGKAGLANAGIAACQIVANGDPKVFAELNDWLAKATKLPSPQIDIFPLNKG